MRNTGSSIVVACLLGLSATFGALSTAGCGGGGGSGGSGGGGGGTGGAPTCYDYSNFDGMSPAVSFKTDVLPVFQRSCGLSSSCHGDINVPKPEQPYFGPNKMTTATDADIQAIIDGLVGKKAVAEPNMNLVTAGDPENSFLMYKLDFELTCSKLSCAEGDLCGDPMPRGSKDPLATAELDAVRRWIAQGAQNN